MRESGTRTILSRTKQELRGMPGADEPKVVGAIGLKCGASEKITAGLNRCAVLQGKTHWVGKW
jgi:hypothetical protein